MRSVTMHNFIVLPPPPKISVSILMKRNHTVELQMCNCQHVCQYAYRCIIAKKKKLLAYQLE